MADQTPSPRPLASVIIPAYNHQDFIPDALRSVEEQDYPHVEIVVVDDGSTDGTGDAAARFLAGSRRTTTLLRQPNQGIVGALQAGLAASHGEYVSFLASDDWIAAHKLSSQVAIALATGAEAVYGTLVRVREDGRAVLHRPPRLFQAEWDADAFVRDLVTAHGPLIQCGLFSRDLLLRTRALHHGLTMDDWPVEIVTARAARRVVTNDDPVTFYRHHAGNATKRQRRLFEAKVETVDALCTGATRRQGLASAHSIYASTLERSGDRLAARAHRRAAARWWPSRVNLRRALWPPPTGSPMRGPGS